MPRRIKLHDKIEKALNLIEVCLQFNATWSQCYTVLKMKDVAISQATAARAIRKKIR